MIYICLIFSYIWLADFYKYTDTLQPHGIVSYATSSNSHVGQRPMAIKGQLNNINNKIEIDEHLFTEKLGSTFAQKGFQRPSSKHTNTGHSTHGVETSLLPSYHYSKGALYFPLASVLDKNLV